MYRTFFVPLPARPGEPESASDTLEIRLHQLPAQMTSFIGREQEVAGACTLLRRRDVRLLTLTGTGGIGKTRLCLQVAAELLNDFADGVCFVPLASVTDSGLVVPTIAQALDLRETGEQLLLGHLKTILWDKHFLLVLDNFEQIMAAAPRLSELLAACPQLKMLITSRTALHLRGEHKFPVPPLMLPDLKHLPDAETLSHFAAVTLFIQHARAIKPDFQITEANARAVAEICVRLDGLPLAIELAATRIKLLPPQALLARLGQRLQLLASSAPDVPLRQQTIRNTITWSYDLLNAQEQRLFRWLSIFVGGCSLEAAEAIGLALDDGETYVLDRVTSLIDKSLLQQEQQGNEEPRLMMLETINAFGLECLKTHGEIEMARRAHADYCLALAQEAESKLGGPQQVTWLERLERDHENLRAALRWLEKGTDQESREKSLRLAGALWRFWWTHGYWSEGQNFLESALKRGEGVEAPVRAKALCGAGVLACSQNHVDKAEAFCRESLALYREVGDTQGTL